MSRRTLGLAAVTLWICAAGPVAAQNLEAGKSPAQIFASTCAICHKSPHGLLKTVPPGSLPGFLRQHYTTSPGMAGAMSAYVLSNGAANRHAGDDLTREGRQSRTLREPRAPEAGAEKPAVREHTARPREDSAGETEVRSKKPKVDKRKPKAAPAKDEPKDETRPTPDTASEPQPAAPSTESSKPAAAPDKPSEPVQSAPDNAQETPVKKPDEDKPASSNMPVFNIEPKSDSRPESAPDSKPQEAPAAPDKAQ
jgi:hypothetical protein